MNLWDRVKYGVPAGITASLMAVTPAFAEGTAQADVVNAFTTAADDIKATVLAVAGVAIGILVIMYAFRWGKKIFNRVAS
jgi:hypothetical protein